MNWENFYDVRLEPYVVSGSEISGLKIALPRLTGAKKGNKYFIKKNSDGVIILIPENSLLM